MYTGFNTIKTLCLLLVLAVLRPCSADPQPTLDAQFSGCAHVAEGPVCILTEDAVLNVWVPTTQPLTLLADNNPVIAEQTVNTDNGTRYSFKLPLSVSSLQIASNTQTFDLKVSRERLPDPIVRARKLNEEREYAEAGRLVESEMSQIPDPWRGVALRMIGQAQRNTGRLDEAQATLKAAIAADSQIGRRSDALRSATVLAFLWLEQGRDFTRARELLTTLHPVVRGDAESTYYFHYYLGLIAYNAGDARTALKNLSRAAGQAKRMGLDRLSSYAESILAVQLQQIGRRDRARQLLAAWVDNLPPDTKPCDRALHLTNLGWADLLLLEAGEQTPDPGPLLAEAFDLSLQHCARTDRMNALTNLALASLHADDIDAAASFVARARAETEAPKLRAVLWLLDIEARVALKQADTSRALDLYNQLRTLADATLSPAARWRAAVGSARVHQAMGAPAAALASFAAAERVVDADIYQVPLDAGRETLLTTRDWATRQHLQLLLANGHDEQAFALARRVRNRSLRALNVAERISALGADQRIRWEQALSHYQTLRAQLDDSAANAWALPADKLARLKESNKNRSRQLRDIVDVAMAAITPPAMAAQAAPVNGEIMLAFHPLPTGWAVFAHNGAALAAYQPECDGLEQNALATCLIAPVTRLLDGATLLRILPTGELREVDFATIKVAGVPLIEKLPIIYSIDIATTRKAVADHGRAVLIADAHGDLASARIEINTVVSVMNHTRRWHNEVYSGAGARSELVMGGLINADLFHFAGHARFQGELGWESELKLADGTAISITDIITLAEVPELVVLSGCETASTAADVRAESIGLANAFLVAGSSAVIATMRPVRDDVARAVMEQFYREWTTGQPLYQALRSAQLALRNTQPGTDWAAFRLIER